MAKKAKEDAKAKGKKKEKKQGNCKFDFTRSGEEIQLNDIHE